MAFADSGAHVIRSGQGPGTVVLAGACVKGDILGYSSGWYQADGNAEISAYKIAAQDGAIGDTINTWEKAVIYNSGFGATPAAPVYLSDTPGKLTQTPSTTNAQRIGFAVSATLVCINQAHMKSSFSVSTVCGALTTAGQNFFIAPFPCRVDHICEVHSTLCSAGTPTLDVVKPSTGEAISAGDTQLAAAMVPTNTANNVVHPTLTSVAASKLLATGDRLALLPNKTLTALASCQVTVQVTRQ
jgi:hypothetical protein